MDKLLQLLSVNSGFTTAELATMLGETEENIKKRIKDYENNITEGGCEKAFKLSFEYSSHYFLPPFDDVLLTSPIKISSKVAS